MWFLRRPLCKLLLASLTAVPCAQAAADTVLVLPFFGTSVFNNAKEAQLGWIGESVAETLRENLSAAGVLAIAREDRVEVYSRLAVRTAVPLTRATVLRIGESLDAAQIVYGSLEMMSRPSTGSSPSRGTLKLTAHIIDRKHLHAGPEFTESGPLEDLSMLESRLAWQCIRYFLPKSTPSQSEFLQNRPPVPVEAVESYIRGLLVAAPEQQQKFFQQAAKVDPRFSEPTFQLGRIAFQKKEYRTASTWLEKVAETDSHYHEAQFLLGLCRYYEGDFDAAAQSFQKVASQVPLDEVFNDLGAAQSRKNRPEAVENFRKALEGDEADPDFWFNLGYAQWKSGQFADATHSFRAVLDRTPDDEEAKTLLARSQRSELPRQGEALGAERIKKTFEESMYLELQAELKK